MHDSPLTGNHDPRGGAGLNPFAGLPGSLGGAGSGAQGGVGGGLSPAMLSSLYMQGAAGGFSRRLPGMMEQVINCLTFLS